MDRPSDRLADLQSAIRAFVADREWERYHDPKNLAMALASETGELLAEYRWVHSNDAAALTQRPDKARRVQEEIGDIAITLLCLCDRLGVDLIEVARTKLVINERHYPQETHRGRPDRA